MIPLPSECHEAGQKEGGGPFRTWKTRSSSSLASSLAFRTPHPFLLRSLWDDMWLGCQFS